MAYTHTAKEVCELAKKAATCGFGDSSYRVSGSTNWTYNVCTYYSGKWRSDCLGFVHAMANTETLFSGDTSKTGGGCTVNDFLTASTEAVTLNKYCSSKGSYPKTDLKAGALLQSSGHVGLYVGSFTWNGNTYNSAECTAATLAGQAWRPTWVDLSTGKRYQHKGGSLISTWEKWGYFSHIDYSVQESGSSSSSGSTSSGTSSYTAKLTVDGKWGAKTTKRLQTVLGTTVDGEISSQNSAVKSAVGKNVSGWVFTGGKGSACIKALQTKLGGLTTDGLCGTKTVKALQKHYGTTQDGYLSSTSAVVKKLQTALNKGTI